jgi:hypothetical protein
MKLDINILGESLGKMADAINQITKSLDKYFSSSEIRRMRKCIKYGDLIVDKLKTMDIKDKELKKYINVWEVYNN